MKQARTGRWLGRVLWAGQYTLQEQEGSTCVGINQTWKLKLQAVAALSGGLQVSFNNHSCAFKANCYGSSLTSCANRMLWAMVQ